MSLAGAFSVTEVRNALRCPRIFALGRLGRTAVAFPVGSSLLGSAFHRIVERFAGAVGAPPAAFAELQARAPIDALDAELRAWLLDLLADDLESDAALTSMPGEVDDLAEALRQLATHLAARLHRFDGNPSEGLSRLVRGGEVPIEAELQPGLVVSGRLDALYADPDDALDVVEYKLTDEANDALDRAQAALYARMLRVARGVDARPVVLRFMPMLRETTVSLAESRDLVDRQLVPLVRKMAAWAAEPRTAPVTERRDLCAACPLSAACAEAYPERVPPRDDPPAGGARPRPSLDGAALGGPASARALEPSPTDEVGRRDAERVRDLIQAELRRAGIQAVFPSVTVGPTLYEIEVTRPRGRVRDLDRAADDVKHHLASQHDVAAELEERAGRRIFVVRRADPRTVHLAPLLAEAREWLAARPGRFVVGQRPTGEVLVGDLADASTPHLLVGGQSGSGKSFLLRSLVASLVHYHPPAGIRFVLVDPKRVTFQIPSFQAAVGAHLDGPIVFDVDSALPVLERLVEVMEERYSLFEAAKVNDVGEYNESRPETDRLERRVVVVDEFQDLTADKATQQRFTTTIRRLGAKARGAGVHLVLATQRPDRETVPGIIKTNLGGKIALRVASAVNSRIILDQPGAEKLVGKGDLLADLGHGLVRAQAPVLG